METFKEFKMELLMLVLCVIPTIVTSITISSNGNSPTIKMLGGMVVDVQQGFVPMTPKPESNAPNINYEKSRKLNINSTKLALNERYRRLIPYMTFYYANDLTTPTTATQNIEVEKAEIVEANHLAQRQPKKIVYSPHRNIPRYQGNRLTQYNIASANPTKVFYKGGVPVYQIPSKVTPNYNPLLSDVPVYNEYNTGRIIQRPAKIPGFSFASTARKPYLNLYNEETPNIRYYLSEKEPPLKYKLVPYEQTPPVTVPQSGNEQVYEERKPVTLSVLVPNKLYVKPRPVRPPFIYDSDNVQQVTKQPVIVSENYYEKQSPQTLVVEPVVESGFKPIATPPEYTTEASIYSSVPEAPEYADFEFENQRLTPTVPVTEKPKYYQYVVEQPKPTPPKQTSSNSAALTSLLNSLQVNKSIPKPINRENVAASIRTLLEVLKNLKAVQDPSEVVGAPVLSTPKPFVAQKLLIKEPELDVTPSPEITNPELHEEPYLAQVHTPSQHLDDDHPFRGGTSQQFPLRVTSDDEGGTPGTPGVDYPILTTIPQTSFDCKTQRYKGFFADTETRCQVWHYCDLNGGQASFLCPNGTIFSQAGLTCDWWFNVRCSTTTQLYVLNESLYKYILPHQPKFPEDYSGPLVDKYLTLKFKEMEEEFNKKKGKQKSSEQMSSEDDDDDEDNSNNAANDAATTTTSTEMDKRQLSTLNESSVIVETPGDSGKVERLRDD